MNYSENIPAILEEVNFSKKKYPYEIIGAHLFVFVHGFQGSSSDMLIFKEGFSMINSTCYFLCSKANENENDIDIGSMGKKLSKEVHNYIKSRFPNPMFLGKISFVGYSLGGLIIRAALPMLEEYKEKMWSLTTFSSPHLGYMFSDSKIISAGLWIVKKWYGSQSLEQLSFTDKSNIRNCYLYKLSMLNVRYYYNNRELNGSKIYFW